jgi:hypothetical protein
MQPTTRRRVVATGIKLAYAAPLVAAAIRLTGDGADAACACPPNTTAAKYFADTRGANAGTCAVCPPATQSYDQATQQCVRGVWRATPLRYVAKVCTGPALLSGPR